MHSAGIGAISVDASCRMMMTGSNDKTARLWALPENGIGEPKQQRVLRVPIGSGSYGDVYAVALSPDGRIAAAGGRDFGQDHDSAVYVFDTRSGKLIRRLGRLSTGINYLTCAHDGKN